jgi:hypothetical protein
MDKMRILDVFLQQLGKSKTLKILALILVASAVGRILTENWYFDYSIFASGYFLLFMVSIAMLTAIHEGAHVTKLQELGFAIDDFTVRRIGDASFHMKEIEKITMEQHYLIAKEPYGVPYITLEFISMVFLLVLSLYSPFPLNILLILVTALACSHLIANFCLYSVIKNKKEAGVCVNISRRLISRGDVDDIVAWNNQLRGEKKEVPI